MALHFTHPLSRAKQSEQVQQTQMKSIGVCRNEEYKNFSGNHLPQMSRIMKKLDFGLCENKGADQLRINCEADQCLCFRYTNSAIPLLSKSESEFPASSHLLCLYSSFVTDLVGNRKDRFSCVTTCMMICCKLFSTKYMYLLTAVLIDCIHIFCTQSHQSLDNRCE